MFFALEFCFVYETWVISGPSRAQLSSAAHRGACASEQRRAVRALLCRAACCVVLTLSYMPGLIQRSIIQQYRGTSHQVCTFYNLNHAKHTPSSAQLSYSSAAPCGAVRCRAVPCLALRCGAVRCCGVLSFEHSTRYHVKYQVPGTGMYVYSSFFFLH